MKKRWKLATATLTAAMILMGNLTAFAAENLNDQVLAHNRQKIESQRIDVAALQCYKVTEPEEQKRWTAKDPETGSWRFYYTEGYTDPEGVVEKLSQEITKNAVTDYEKCKAIHDWVCKNIWYDWDTFRYSEANNGTVPVGFDTSPVSVLKTKKTICDGYANLTVALLREAGIPAKKMTGYALGAGTEKKWTESLVSGDRKQEVNHAWTAAFVDGRWLIMDATWDSQNKYENGRFGAQRAITYKYFDMTAEKLSQTHKIIGADVNIPTAELFNLTEEERMALWEERNRTEFPNDAMISVLF